MANWSKKPDDIIACGRGKLRKLLPSGTWHFRHRAPDGKWRWRSTGHHDRKGAISWAEAFSMRLTREEFTGVPAERSGATSGPAAAGAPSIRRGLVYWLGYQAQQNEANTLRAYRSIAVKFCGVLRPLGIRHFDQIDRSVMVRFREYCLSTLGNSRVTIDNNLIALRSFFSWAVVQGWMATNPASQSRHGEKLFFDEPPVRKDTYSRAEYERILAASTGDAQRVFTLLGSWGLRISELAMLEWTDIDRASGWVHIRNKITHDGTRYRPKDKTDRKLPLDGERVLSALEWLAVRTQRAGYVLPLRRAQDRSAVAERRFLQELKAVSQSAQIPAKRLTLHRFRHFFVCECADHNVPMATVMNWVGHDEMKMVMHYYSLRDTSAREAMRRLNSSAGTADASSGPAAGP